MSLRVGILGIVLLLGYTGFAQSYDELADQLSAATEKADIHRLKAQVADAAIQRLETKDLSKTAAKKLREEILAHCADVQLGTMDLWYGNSVVTWARLMLQDGQWKEARSMLWDQAEVLQNIEKNLTANHIPVSSISPVAGCRYVLGETYRHEYEAFQTLEPAAEALKHFYNVYIKYGDSPWGEPAREKAEAAQAFLESHGKQVRIELGAHRDAFIANKFRLGARLMADEHYADAIEPIETAINVFPEKGASVEALRNLAICQLHLGHHDQVVMIAEYISERFQADPNAPLAVLALGRKYIDANDTPNGEACFDLYLKTFPDDTRRADILSYFAWKAYKAEQWKEAVSRFQTLEVLLREKAETGPQLEKAVYVQATHPADPAKLDAFMAEFPESEFMAPALNKKAQALLVAGNFDAAFQTLETLKKQFPEATVAKASLSGLIVAAVDAERFDIAEQVLDRMLDGQDAYGYDVYISTGDGLLASDRFTLAEKSFSAVPMSAKQTFVERALFGRAACQFGREQFETCFQTLENLLNQFPTTGLFYDARLMQARSLVQLGRTEEAVAAYAEVAAARQNYAVTFEMAAVLDDPEAQLATYQRIALLADPAEPENRALIADSILISLPLCIDLQKYDLVLSSCSQFEELFPTHEQLPIIGTFRKEAERALAQ
ncbi:tetratricopeptide repeat protein [Pontiellaceae bacterium B1224]|nr:tetratricopeptide repeat protein [Pontiellaceae bacterium B1224]